MGLASWANRYQPPGNCAIVVSTMKWLRENFHFGFLVGNIPVTPADVASFDQVRWAARQVNNFCVAPPPQGDGWGEIQRTDKSPVLRTRHSIESLWWTLLNPVDRSISQPGRHSVRAVAVCVDYFQGLQLARYDSSGEPAYSKTQSKPLKIGGMLVTRRSTYHNIAERSMRSTITVVADFSCSQQHHIT